MLRGDAAFPIEVKCSKDRKLYLSGRTLDQHDALVATGERTGLMPLYAYRLKGTRGDSWRIFRVETGGLTGTLARLATMIPALPLNRNGSPFIDWNQGMPLNRFIGLLCSPEGETAPLKALSKRAAHQTTTMAEDTQRSTDDILAELARRRSALLPFKGKE